MIYTGSYKEFNNTNFKTISISKDKGKDAGYVGESYLALAPKEEFFRTWKNNRGIIDELENNRYYIKEFYNQILSDLDPNQILNELDGYILLCYEDSNEFCHRHIVAEWIDLMLGVKLYEVKTKDNLLEVVERPKYIREMLEEVINVYRK